MRIHYCIVAVMLALVVGCNNRPSEADTKALANSDNILIGVLIEELTDYKTTPRKWDRFFVKGAPRPDTKKFAVGTYYLMGQPTVSGTTATAQVSMEDVGGKKIGQTEWTFEKDADKWKIKSAPLP